MKRWRRRSRSADGKVRLYSVSDESSLHCSSADRSSERSINRFADDRQPLSVCGRDSGFISWSLANRPHVLERALARRAAAIVLSFGDPRPFAPTIRNIGARLVCQVQTVPQAREAAVAGASIYNHGAFTAGTRWKCSRSRVSTVQSCCTLPRLRVTRFPRPPQVLERPWARPSPSPGRSERNSDMRTTRRLWTAPRVRNILSL